MAGTPSREELRPSHASIFARFLRFGVQAWGGPIPQIAMMHEALVEKERWIDDAQFRRVLGVYQALPGPEAVELAVYFGYQRRGRWAGLLSGLGFLLPGLVLTLGLAHLYRDYGGARAFAGVLYAVKPLVIALLVHALLRIGKASLVNEGLVLVAIGAGLAAYLLPLNFIVVLFATGALYFFAMRRPAQATPGLGLTLPLAFVGGGVAGGLAFFLFFLQAGLVTFGGAYTVIPFLEEGAVREFHWLTADAFLDSVALCSLLPAPLVIVATFVGYQVGGISGGLVASLGVFLPAFLFTLAAHEPLVRLVESPRGRDFFEGVTAAVVGLIAITAARLASAAFPDPLSIALGLVGFLALRVMRVNVAFVMLGGGAVGVLLDAIAYV